MADAWVAYICDYFDKNPTQSIFPLSPNDGMTRICECGRCQAQVVPDMGKRGKFSNYVWGFINRVAKGVADTHPGKYVGGIAYEAYSTPPTTVEKLRPNVAVMLCKARGGYADPVYRQKVEADLAGWRRKADKLYCWEYYREAVPPWRGFPVIYPHLIAEDVKTLKGVIAGEFVEAESWVRGDLPQRINFPGMQHLNLYLTAQLYWDAERNVDELLEEYYALFYGPAAESMKAFWRRAEEAWMSVGGRATSIGIVREPSTVFTTPVIEELSTHLETARLRTAEDSVYRKRVDLIGNEFRTAKGMMTHPRVVEPPELIVRGPVDDIEVDGVMNEPAWKHAASTTFLAKNAEAAQYPTTLCAAWDARYLYLAFVNEEPEMAQLNIGATERDQSFGPGMWDDDSVEIFLAPNPKIPEQCYQFIINPKGLIWDAAHGFDDRPSTDKAWDAAVEAKGTFEQDRWTLEVRIPLEDVGLGHVAEGKRIAGNFFRNRYCGGPPLYSGWSPTISTAHFTPRRFGTIAFERK